MPRDPPPNNSLLASLLRAQALLYTYAQTGEVHGYAQDPPRLCGNASDELLEAVSRGAASFFRRRINRVAAARTLAREASQRRTTARRERDGWRESACSEAMRSFWQHRASTASWPPELVNFSTKFQAEVYAPQQSRVLTRNKRPRSPSSAPRRGRPKRRRKGGGGETETPFDEPQSSSAPAVVTVDAKHLVFGQWAGDASAAAEKRPVGSSLQGYCLNLLRAVAGMEEVGEPPPKAEPAKEKDSGNSIPIVPIKRLPKGGVMTLLCGLPLEISQQSARRRAAGRYALLREKPQLLPALCSSSRHFEYDERLVAGGRDREVSSRLIALTRQLEMPPSSRPAQGNEHIKSKHQCRLTVEDLSSMSVSYEPGGQAYTSHLHVAEPLRATDAICLASLTLLLGAPCPEITPAVRSLQRLFQMSQASDIKLSAEMQAQLEAESSEIPISFSEPLQVSPYALQEYYANVIVKSGSSGDWIRRAWAYPVNFEMDSTSSQWRESSASTGDLVLPTEALLFFARRLEREKRRPKPSKPANAFVLEKALKAEPTGRQPTDELLLIARLPLWASFYRHSDSWDIVNVLISLAPVIGGPLFAPMDAQQSGLAPPRLAKSNISSLLARFQPSASLPPILFSRLVRILPSNSGDQHSYDPAIFVSNALALPSLLTIKSSSRVVRKLEVCWHPCDEAALWQAVMDQAPTATNAVVDSGLFPSESAAVKSFPSALTELRKQIDMATVSSKSSERTRAPSDRRAAWACCGVNWNLVASCLNTDYAPFDRFRSAKVCQAKFVSLWAEYMSTLFSASDRAASQPRPPPKHVTPQQDEERTLIKEEEGRAENDWEEALADQLEKKSTGPLVARELRHLRVRTWAKRNEEEVEALLNDLESGHDRELPERSDCCTLEAVQMREGANRFSRKDEGTPLTRLAKFRMEVSQLSDVSADSVAGVVRNLSEEFGEEPQDFIASAVSSKRLQGRLLERVWRGPSTQSCPLRNLQSVDMNLTAAKIELEPQCRLEPQAGAVLASDASPLQELEKFCNDVLTEFAQLSVPASDLLGIAHGMELNTLVIQCSKLLESLQIAGLISPIAHAVLRHSKTWTSAKEPQLPVLVDVSSQSAPSTAAEQDQIRSQIRKLEELRASLVLATYLNQTERLALHLHGNSKTKGLLKKKPGQNQHTVRLHENFVLDRALRLHVQQSRQCLPVLQALKTNLTRKNTSMGEISAATVYQQTLLHYDKLFLPPHASQTSLLESAKKQQASLAAHFGTINVPAAITNASSLAVFSQTRSASVSCEMRGCLMALVVVERYRRQPLPDKPVENLLMSAPLEEFRSLHEGSLAKLDISKSPFPAVTAVARAAQPSFPQAELKNSPRKRLGEQRGWQTESWKQQAPLPQAAWGYGTSPRPQQGMPTQKFAYSNRLARAPTEVQAMPMAQANGFAPLNSAHPQWVQMQPNHRPYHMPPQETMSSSDSNRALMMRPAPSSDIYRTQQRLAYTAMPRAPPQWPQAGRPMGMDASAGWGAYGGGGPQFAYATAAPPYGRQPIEAWGPPPGDAYAQQRYMADSFAQQPHHQQLDFHSAAPGEGMYHLEPPGYKLPWPQKQ